MTTNEEAAENLLKLAQVIEGIPLELPVLGRPDITRDLPGHAEIALALAGVGELLSDIYDRLENLQRTIND